MTTVDDAAAPVRRVDQLMGTVISIDVRDRANPATVATALDEAFAWLHHVEATFSVYRRTSEISRIGRGELHPDDASAEVREVLVRCDELRTLTHGAFEHRPPGRPDRPLDPNAVVKGWSIDRAALLLQLRGLHSYCINAGGDVRWLARFPGYEPLVIAADRVRWSDRLTVVA